MDIEVARLRLLKADHQSKHYELEDNLLKYYPENIEATKARIAGAKKDTERYNTNLPKAAEVTPAVTEAPACAGAAASEAEGEAKAPAAPPFPAMIVMGVEYTEKEPAAKALLEACKTVTGKDSVMIGSYLGFDMSISFDSFHKKFTLTLKGELSYSAELGTDTFGNITRINNALRAIPERRESAKAQLENLCRQVEDAKKELQNPFALEDELTAKEARLALINTELNIDGGRDALEVAEPELRQVAYAKNPRPSILEGLRMYGVGKENGHSDKPKTNDRIM